VLLIVEEDTDIIPTSHFTAIPPRLKAFLIGNTDYATVLKTIQGDPIAVSGSNDQYKKYPPLPYVAVKVRRPNQQGVNEWQCSLSCALTTPRLEVHPPSLCTMREAVKPVPRSFLNQHVCPQVEGICKNQKDGSPMYNLLMVNSGSADPFKEVKVGSASQWQHASI
jgi:hypothetical protein